MKQIGFKNFRRFENFPAIDLAPITILVGENNAGKSTVVKGILALSDFLNGKRRDYPFIVREESVTKKKKATIEMLNNFKFYFNSSYFAHIGTFKRALCNKTSENDSTISFYTSIGPQNITIDVTGDKNSEEDVSGIVSRVCVEYLSVGIRLDYNLQKDLATVIFNPVNVSEDQLLFLSPKKRKKAKAFLESIPHSYEFVYHISDFCRNYLSDFIYLLIASTEIALSSIMEFDKTLKHIGSELINELKPIGDIDDESKAFLKEFTKNVCSGYRGESWIFLLPESDMIKRFFMIEYIYAHAVTQTVIYSAKDTNDYLSNTIHEYASIPRSISDYRKDFIIHWMKEFNIGKDFEITSVGGEAHLVNIVNFDDRSVNLADKGMGSIQLMVLLFRLAITLPKNMVKNRKKQEAILQDRLSRILIIEEPEQNLHPMLQSKLADLFYELNINYGFRFIIETHSEYLIRKTQVIVGEKYKNSRIDEFESENPFKVYYFPQSGIPYDMEYTNKGGFKQKFGDGFFNEASRLNSSVIKNKLED